MRKIKLKILNEQLLKESNQLGDFEKILFSNMLKVMEKDPRFLAKVNASLSKTSKATYNTPKSAFDAHFKGLKGAVQHLKDRTIELTLTQIGILKSSPAKLKLAESSRSKPKKLKIIVENKKQLLNEVAVVDDLAVLFGAAVLAAGGVTILSNPQTQRQFADAGRRLDRGIDHMILQAGSLIAATATGVYHTWIRPSLFPSPTIDSIPDDLPDEYVPRPVPPGPRDIDTAVDLPSDVYEPRPVPIPDDLPAEYEPRPAPKDTTPDPPGGGEPPKGPKGPWWAELYKFCFNGEQLSAIFGSSLELKLIAGGKSIVSAEAIKRIANIPAQLLKNTFKLIGSQFNLKTMFCQTLFAGSVGLLIDFLRTIPPSEMTNRDFEAQRLENNYALYTRTLGWSGFGGFAGAIVFTIVKDGLDLVGPQSPAAPGQVAGEQYGAKVTKNFEDVLRKFKILPDYNPAEITFLKFYYAAMIKSGLVGQKGSGKPITTQQLNRKFKEITKAKGGDMLKLKNDLLKSFFQLTISSVNKGIKAVNDAEGGARGKALDGLIATLTKLSAGLNKAKEVITSKIGTETQVPLVGEEGETYADLLAKSIDSLRKPIDGVLKELNSIKTDDAKLEQFYNDNRYKIPVIDENAYMSDIIAALQGIKGPTPPPPKKTTTRPKFRSTKVDPPDPNQ